MQKNVVNAGATPLLNFVGNSCSTAMNALQTVGVANLCNGVDPPGAETPGHLHAIPNPTPIPESSYPSVDAGQRAKAKICDAANQQDCSKVPACTGENPKQGGLASCAVTTIDHFTTSFNWSQKNFSAIWLRGWWYLLRDSALTDIQSGGLSMVTGGGYTRSDVAYGYWSLSQRNLFVGNTQKIPAGGLVPANPAASNAGPFNPYALHCNYSPSFCVSEADGISFQLETFNAQRLLNIYDGPSFEDSDAFADVHTTAISTLDECKPNNNNPGSCSGLKWSAAYNSGVLQAPDPANSSKKNCVLPNAAIAWKQPNGFYYPPAFNSRNLSFTNVDIRHFVVQPLWQPQSFIQDDTAVKNTYCTWEPGMFNSFTDVDRQTELTDLDGSLTGLLSQTTQSGHKEPSISITNDPFFVAPVETPECASNVPQLPGTVVTSPYEYNTTVVYPVCSAGATGCGTKWGRDCTRQACYGVPLYRQTLTDKEYSTWQSDPTQRPSIRMMGQEIFQRSNLTLNHAHYYIDTTLSAADQPAPIKNVFAPGGRYMIFVLYAKPSLRQKYSLYIGKVDEADGLASITAGRINANGDPYQFAPGGDWIKDKTYSPTTGLLEFTVDLSGQQTEFEKDRTNFCQPKSYCSYKEGEDGKPGECGCAPGSSCTDNSVCSWGVQDIECPTTGCYGLQLTLPATFEAKSQPDLPPTPIRFSDLAEQGDAYFKNVSFLNVDKEIAGECHYENPPLVQGFKWP